MVRISSQSAIRPGESDSTIRKDKREWRFWDTEAIAFQQSPTEQSKYWNDTEQFRLPINNHKTYPHMRPWLELLNTGQDSRYLSGIAGEDTLVLAPRESAKAQPMTFLHPTRGRVHQTHRELNRFRIGGCFEHERMHLAKSVLALDCRALTMDEELVDWGDD